MGNVIDLASRVYKPIKGKATLVIPLDDTYEEFEPRLIECLHYLLGTKDIRLSGGNFANEHGQQMMIFHIDFDPQGNDDGD